MILTQTDKSIILSNFPNIKLSYENIIYKKVLNCDFIVAIPKGKKCFAWFTYKDDEPVCFILELGNGKEINDIKVIKACYSTELCYGTIIYGTLFFSSGNKFFTIEDIFYYKNENFCRENWTNKLNKICQILEKDIKQVTYSIKDSFVIFGSPIICKSHHEIIKKLDGLNYNIDSIQFKLFNKTNSCLFMNYEDYINEKFKIYKTSTSYKQNNINTQREKSEFIFNIRPDICDDIYYLYSLNENNEEEQYSIALIPDYNTSVMMNQLFRIIKENKNLDALEESDDEEEFENEKIDKFVYLDKSYKMLCVFNSKFKKWVPIKTVNDNEKVIETKYVRNFYKSTELIHNQKKTR